MGEGTQSEKEKSSSVLIRMGWGRELSGREKEKSGCKIIREGWQEGGHHIHTCTGCPKHSTRPWVGEVVAAPGFSAPRLPSLLVPARLPVCHFWVFKAIPITCKWMGGYSFFPQ